MAELVQRAQRFFRTPRGSATRIILGSSSKVRRKLMDELCQEAGGFKYDVLTADIDEKAIRRDDPEDLVTVLAKAKATAIQNRMTPEEKTNADALLITCDQVSLSADQAEDRERERENRSMCPDDVVARITGLEQSRRRPRSN